ncbi:MAG: hydrogenase expression/formation protein HypE [Planctomycetes bacterium]|jgi:hydrogenase expression/formation protein HypE|nr:hydrogenase expression/formation protein HypE [Planctomycetota bacterium]
MHDRITLSHGGGGSLTRELVESVFLPAFGSEPLSLLEDSAVLRLPPGRTAFTTDSFVVKPLFFRGGDIGRLAVCGTVNDLAVAGAVPRFLSVAFVLEEGLEIEILRRVALSIAEAAREAGVQVVTGDTKVVEKGAVDRLFVNTAGIGEVPEGRRLGAAEIRPGDRVLVSGTLGDHGIAVLSEREGIRFSTPVSSDVAPLNGLVAAMLAAGGVRAMRDCTRGGLAAAVNEFAGQARVGVELREEDLPVRPEVAAACDLLGLDPLTVANEGKLVAFADPGSAAAVLAAMRAHAYGAEARIAGETVAAHPGTAVVRTRIGGRKILEMPYGEGLPRIC